MFPDALAHVTSVMTKATAAISALEDASARVVVNDGMAYIAPQRRISLVPATTTYPPSTTLFEQSVMNSSSSLLANYKVVVSISAPKSSEQFRLQIVSAFEHINWGFDRSTELTVARVDPLYHNFDCQITKFRFNTTCHGDCYRTPQACVNAFTAYATHGKSSGFTPDYRPEPVMGSYAWVGGDIALALGVERDVLEVRGLAKDVLVNVINVVNAKT
eukprot:PhM_4_TR2460/c4_g1_i1/m.15267